MKHLWLGMLGASFGLWLLSCMQDSDGAVFVGNELRALPPLIRVQTQSPNRLRRLLMADGVDVTGSNQRSGVVEWVCPSQGCTAVMQKYARLIQPGTTTTPRPVRSLGDYHDPAEVQAFLETVENNYPHIAQKVILRDDLPQGGVIWAMKISDNVSVDEDEPTFLMDGQIHAREVMTAEVMVDAIDTLTQHYGADPKVTRWVNQLEIWIVPVVNPDGANYVHHNESWWRKNRSAGCEPKGVDLNRNFAWNYRACRGSDDQCESPIYHGPGPASEPETQAMQKLIRDIMPLYYLNYHSFGEILIWPTACARTAEHEMYQTIAEELNQIVENDAGQTGEWTLGTASDLMYPAPGAADDFAYGAGGAIAFTFEINASSFQPDYPTWRDLTCQRQRAGWQHLLDRTLEGPRLSGHVRDAHTQDPIAANVFILSLPSRLGQENLRSNEAGRFGRVVAPHTSHRVLIAALGYLPQVHQVQVGSGPTDVDVRLTQGANHAPDAQAGEDLFVQEGALVRLDAHLSTDPDGNELMVVWEQIEGPPVELDAANRLDPSFFAPGVDADTWMVWELRVSDGLLTSQDQVSVVIQNVFDERFVFTAEQTPTDIPDADPQGLTSLIQVASHSRVLRAKAQVDIAHESAGDLLIRLISPAGTPVVLQEPFWSAQVDLHQEFSLDPILSEMSSGTWALHITDVYAGGQGVLEGWSLILELVETVACGHHTDCQLPQVSQVKCQAGLCQVDSCIAGFGDCNLAVVDGCETPLMENLQHCGTCHQLCQAPFAQTQCQQGLCQIASCEPDRGDCNQASLDGCETDLRRDPNHCGVCDRDCHQPHADVACLEKTCLLVECVVPWSDCDDDVSNGCETDLDRDANHCGECGQVCALAQATSDCIEGICRIRQCDDSWADCDSDWHNGCEIHLASDKAHCGHCFLVCDLPHAQSRCELGHCTLDRCDRGFADCDQVRSNGCEVDLSAHNEHCGTCQTPCQVTQQCRFGVCVDSCRDLDADGYQDIQCGGLDCDDQNKQVFPTQHERCNGVDDDCDAKVDEQGVCDSGCASLMGRKNQCLVWILVLLGCLVFTGRRDKP